MLNRPSFDIGVWYMTKDYKELYKIVYHRGDPEYTVIKYYDGSTMYKGTLYKVRKYMEDNCISHDNYIRWCLLDGK